MLRMVPRYPKSITATELAQRLEEHDFAVTMRSIQRDLEKLSTDFPLLVDESARPFRWSFDREASMDIIPALDLPAALTFELAKAYLTPMLPPRALSHLEPHFNEAHRALSRDRNPLGQWPSRVRVVHRGIASRIPVQAHLPGAQLARAGRYQCPPVWPDIPRPERLPHWND
jgi:hypothetical protein